MGRWIWKGIFPGLLLVLWTVAFGYAEDVSSEAVSFAAVEKTGPQEVTKPGEEGIEEEGIPDPLEPWNRLMFDFNDSFYFWVYKPFAQGYNYVVAEELRIGFRNFFTNLAMPVRFVNNILQFKFDGAGIEIARFVVNTVAGFVGCIDVAGEYLHLRPYREDFGQTLGAYGLGHGLYVVWPFIGPSSLRDTFGMAGDSFLHPVTYLMPGTEWVFATRTYEYANDRSLRIGEYEDIVKNAVDPYISVRDGYYQYRKRQVQE